MSRTIYCISGLGTDERIFSKLRPVGYSLHYIPQLLPGTQETLRDYAARLAEFIKEDDAILMGVSFGGMLGIEISKIKPLQKLIIISGVKSSEEMPRWMKVAGKLKLNRVLPVRSYKFTERIDNNRLGLLHNEVRHLGKLFVDISVAAGVLDDDVISELLCLVRYSKKFWGVPRTLHIWNGYADQAAIGRVCRSDRRKRGGGKDKSLHTCFLPAWMALVSIIQLIA